MENCKIAIGSKIKGLREQKNITLEEMATKSTLSVEYLEAIEGDTQVPAIGELIKIARVLGVRVGTILDDFSNEGPVISYAKEREENPVMRGKSGSNAAMSYYSLSSRKQDRHMETYAVNLAATQQRGKLSSHEGEEFIYVLEGEIEVVYGKEYYKLGKGDSIYYDSIIPHYVGAISAEGAKTLAVVYIPA